MAAVAENGVIGDGEDLPWESLPADRAQYRARVADHPVILGRRTFEQMLDDLPGRAQIVLSRTDRSFPVETATHARNAEEAIAMAESLDAEVAYVLGGAAIYALFQPRVDRMLISRVPGEYEGVATYPAWDPDEWRLVRETPDDGFTLEEWVRVGGT